MVDTMPCFRDSKKKKVIDLSTLSRHSEPFGASWPSSDLQAAAVTQTRSPAAVGTPPLRSENTDASLCRQAEKEGERRQKEADSLVRAPLSVRLFTQLVRFLQPANLQMCFNPRICDYKQLLCGPALLLLLCCCFINR